MAPALDKRAAPRRHTHVGILIDAEQRGVLGAEQPPAGFDDALEHRRGVVDGLADRAQNFRRRALLRQRVVDLPEQSRVLDGDDGLIGEGLDQLDDALGIFAGVPAST